MTDPFADELARAYRATEQALPSGWQLDGLRCASTGVSPEQRSDTWRAIARGPDGSVLEGRGADPRYAMDDLVERLRAL